MKKLITFLAFASLSSFTTQAQISIGPEVGFNLTSVQAKAEGVSANLDSKAGFRIGAIADIGLTSHLFLRPSIQYAMFGGKDGDVKKLTNESATFSINYLHIPVSVLYKFGETGLGRFYVGVTPYLGYAFGGKTKFAGIEKDLEIGSDKDKDDIKPLDFGAGIKVGYELPLGLYVDASFLQGFSNNDPVGNSDNKQTNRLITIGVGYYLFNF